MTEPPPSRYRVVERGRRLEVIDRQSGQRLGAPTPAAPGKQGPARSARVLPQQVRFDGGAEWRTHRLYDEKAPRTIQLDPGSASIVRGAMAAGMVCLVVFAAAAIAWPWLLVVLAIPFQRDVRRPVRAAITRWLDRVDRESR